jgi:hypothetical protein
MKITIDCNVCPARLLEVQELLDKMFLEEVHPDDLDDSACAKALNMAVILIMTVRKQIEAAEKANLPALSAVRVVAASRHSDQKWHHYAATPSDRR